MAAHEIASAAGYAAPTSLTRRLGIVGKDGVFHETVPVASASAIVQAMGLAPDLVPWL